MIVPIYFYILLGVIVCNGIVLIIEDIIELSQVIENLEGDWAEIWDQLNGLIDKGETSTEEYDDLIEKEKDIHSLIEEKQDKVEELRKQESADETNKNNSSETSDQQSTDDKQAK